jgi:hypothetical protein
MTNNNLEQLARQSIQQRLTDAHANKLAAQCRSRHPLACYAARVLHNLANWLDGHSQAEARTVR